MCPGAALVFLLHFNFFTKSIRASTVFVKENGNVEKLHTCTYMFVFQLDLVGRALLDLNLSSRLGVSLTKSFTCHFGVDLSGDRPVQLPQTSSDGPSKRISSESNLYL